MNLYLISQDENDDWDTYDSAVVAAEGEAEAKAIHPGFTPLKDGGRQGDSMWASSPENVEAKLIGMAAPFTKQGVILASFNAG